MKKIISIFVCVCVLLSAMVFTAAADTTAEVVLTVDSLGLASQSYTSDTATVDGVGFEWIQLGNYGDGIQVRDKNGNTSTLWNTTAFSAPIKEIKLVYSDTKSTYDNPDAEIFSFGNEAGTYTYSTKLSTTVGVKEYTITPDAENYTFFKFEHDLGYTMYWKSMTIVLTGDQGGQTPPPACTHDNCTATSNGDETHTDVCDACGENVGTATPCEDQDNNGNCDACGGDVAAKPENNDPAADSELTIAQAIALGTSKEHNTYTTDKYYVTGKIVESYGSNYATYGNFYVEDESGNKFLVYGIYNTDGTVRYDDLETKPVIGDTIKVYGTIGQFNGTAQMKNGWLVELIQGNTPVDPDPDVPVDPPVDPEPEDPTPDVPADPDTPDVNNIILTVDTLGLPSESYNSEAVKGTVGSVEFEWIQLGNYGDGIQVRDKDGKTSSFWNTVAFEAPIKEIKLVYSDTKSTYDNPDAEIFSFGNEAGTYTYSTKLSTTVGVKEYTITPDAENYTFFKFEHDLGYTMYWKSMTIVLVGGTGEAPNDTTPPSSDNNNDDQNSTPMAPVGAVTAPAAGTAYKFALVQQNLGKVLYVTGEMDAEKTYYMATTEDVNAAADVYLEETEGGYYIYALVNGAKRYMNIVESEGSDGKMHTNAVYGDAGVSVFTLNTEKNVLVTKIGDADYAFGTYNTFNTVSPSNFTKYPDNFWCQLYTGKVEVTGGNNDSNGGSGSSGDADTGNGGSSASGSTEGGKTVFGVVANPVKDTAYKFGMVQGNLKKTLYLTGEMNGYYMATTEDASKAADVYLEETTGGFYMYAMVKGVKKYMNIVEAEGSDGKTHVNATFDDKPISVYTYNATLKTYVTKVGEKEYGFGTRNDKSYNTISPSETKYTDNFWCQFYGMTTVAGSPDTSDNIGAVVAFAMVAAAAVVLSKKRV